MLPSIHRAFRRINSHLRALIPRLHHFLRLLRRASLTLLKPPPAGLRNSLKAAKDAVFSLRQSSTCALPAHRSFRLKEGAERLPHAALRKDYARE